MPKHCKSVNKVTFHKKWIDYIYTHSDSVFGMLRVQGSKGHALKRTGATAVNPIAANQGTAQLPHPPFAMSPRSPLAIQQEDGMGWKKNWEIYRFFWEM